MRRYYLASSEDRDDVDLRKYEKIIEDAVLGYMPTARVEVHEHWYTVDPTPDKGNAIRIGRVLSDKDVLGKYCVKIPKLFCSEEVEKGSVLVNGTQKKCVGGHR